LKDINYIEVELPVQARLLCPEKDATQAMCVQQETRISLTEEKKNEMRIENFLPSPNFSIAA